MKTIVGVIALIGMGRDAIGEGRPNRGRQQVRTQDRRFMNSTLGAGELDSQLPGPKL